MAALYTDICTFNSVKAEKLRREREEGHGRSSRDHDGHSRLATDHSSKSAVAVDQRMVSDRPSHTDRHARSTHDDRSVLRSHSRSARTLDDITTSYKDDFTAASSASAPDGASRTAPSQSRKKSTHHRYVFCLLLRLFPLGGVSGPNS